MSGSKVYDGTANASASILTITNNLDGNNLTLTGTGILASKNVGSESLTSSGGALAGLTLTGSAAPNYTLTGGSGTVTVTARNLTVTAATNNKTYDATTSAAALPTVSGLQPGDTVSGLSEAYASKNAGTGLTLTVTSYTVNDGNGGANYSVSTANNTTGAILARAITVTGATNSKIYDATTAALATPTITSGALQGSDTAGFTEAYAAKDAGTGLTLTPTGVNDGNGGANYAVTFANNTTGVITAKALTVSGLSVAAKTYDATTGETISGSPTLGSAEAAATGTTTDGKPYAGDAVSISGTPSGSFANDNVGTGLTVTVSGLSVGGAQAGDYTLTMPILTANILPLDVVLSGGGVFSTTDVPAADLSITNNLDGSNLTLSGTGSVGEHRCRDSVLCQCRKAGLGRLCGGQLHAGWNYQQRQRGNSQCATSDDSYAYGYACHIGGDQL